MKSALEIIDKQDWLDKAADIIQPKVLNTFKSAGTIGNQTKNLLHGKWFGHPIHPMITDVPIGAWSVGLLLDVAELAGSKKFNSGADAATLIGVIGAGGAAVTGITDWTGTTSIERKTGLLHGLLNISATALYIGSLLIRKRKNKRKVAIALSMLGYGLTTISAYLGGTLVYNKQMGVNHTAIPLGYPKKFTPVLENKELKEGALKCVHADKVDILLVRKKRKIYAIANTCSHLGGPLSEGELVSENCIRCPWHQSIFSLVDGNVVDGPATQPQPTFETRVRKGKIEVKLKNGWVE